MPKGVYKRIKQFSEEQKRKIGNGWRGKKRPPFSEEWKRKISNSHKKINHPWLVKYQKGNIP
jgi:hypothetical protein